MYARRDVHCTLPGSPACSRARRLVLAPRPLSRSPTTYDPHSIRCTAGCHTSRDFVPWRFSDAGRRSAWIASSCRHPKTYTGADIAKLFSLRMPGSRMPNCEDVTRGCRTSCAAASAQCYQAPAWNSRSAAALSMVNGTSGAESWTATP